MATPKEAFQSIREVDLQPLTWLQAFLQKTQQGMEKIFTQLAKSGHGVSVEFLGGDDERFMINFEISGLGSWVMQYRYNEAYVWIYTIPFSYLELQWRGIPQCLTPQECLDFFQENTTLWIEKEKQFKESFK